MIRPNQHLPGLDQRTLAAYDRTFNGQNDVFVVKALAAGDQLLCATFVGGDDADLGKAVAQDEYGHIFISGATTSLDPDGTELMVSTVIGGMSWESSWGVALTPSSDCILTGITRSPNFPTNPGVFDNSYNGGTDGFAASLPIAGSDRGEPSSCARPAA